MAAPAVSLASSLQPAAPAGAPSSSSRPMPSSLQHFIDKIDEKRRENERKALWDGLKFWSLKVPAIIAAGGSGVTAFLTTEMHLSLAILNGLLGICVALDGMIHPGEHRNLHRRASEGLRNLKDSVQFAWWAEPSPKNHNPEDSAAQIVAKAQKEWKKITDFLDGTLFAAASTSQQGDKGP